MSILEVEIEQNEYNLLVDVHHPRLKPLKLNKMHKLRTIKRMCEGLNTKEKNEIIWADTIYDCVKILISKEEDKPEPVLKRYGKMAYIYMEETYPYIYKEIKNTNMRYLLKKIFLGFDKRCDDYKWELFNRMLENDPVDESGNILERTAHRQMIMHEAEEIMISEMVHTNHFDKDFVREKLEFYGIEL